MMILLRILRLSLSIMVLTISLRVMVGLRSAVTSMGNRERRLQYQLDAERFGVTYAASRVTPSRSSWSRKG